MIYKPNTYVAGDEYAVNSKYYFKNSILIK